MSAVASNQVTPFILILRIPNEFMHPGSRTADLSQT